MINTKYGSSLIRMLLVGAFASGMTATQNRAAAEMIKSAAVSFLAELVSVRQKHHLDRHSLYSMNERKSRTAGINSFSAEFVRQHRLC